MNKGALWNTIEKSPNVKVEHPIHFSRQQSRVQGIQRLMLASPWSEPVREAEKIRFVDGVQHLDRRALSGRAMARSGLRMMPPFPSPSLKVGSRPGAVSCRFRLPGAPRFLWEWTH